MWFNNSHHAVDCADARKKFIVYKLEENETLEYSFPSYALYLQCRAVIWL